MPELLTILWLLAVVLLLLGLIKPKLSLFGSKKPTRLKVLGIYSLLIVVFFILIGIFAPDNYSKDKPNIQEQVYQDQEISSETITESKNDATSDTAVNYNDNGESAKCQPSEMYVAEITNMFLSTEYQYNKFKYQFTWAANRGLSPAKERETYKADDGYYPLMEWSIYWMSELQKS